MTKLSLRFVSWNTNGIKPTKEREQKFSDLLGRLKELEADVAFIQETHAGTECLRFLQNIPGWRSYFTVHSSRSKGVAILIKDTVPFEYIWCIGDFCGGYIVLFCHLHGELYTLVNVYNHKDDRIVLGRLKGYLMERAEGVLVVGGDFNTVLEPTNDREPSITRHSPLRPILQDFTDSLKITDTWSQKHSDTDTKNRFTWKRGKSSSRIDMFFLQEDQIQSITKIEVKIVSISDHYPLVLKLQCQMQFKGKLPKIATNLEKYNSYMRAVRISGEEILRARESLPKEYKQDNWHLLIETVRLSHNDMLNDHNLQVLENFNSVQDSYEFTVKDFQISEVLAEPLNAFLLSKTKYKLCLIIVNFNSSEQKIRWSFLKSRRVELKNDKLKQAPCDPPGDFSLLDSLLLESQSTSGELRVLKHCRPLTSAVVNLALDQLNLMHSGKAMKTIVSYHKKTLIIHAQQNKRAQIDKIAETFQYESHVRLIVQRQTNSRVSHELQLVVNWKK